MFHRAGEKNSPDCTPGELSSVNVLLSLKSRLNWYARAMTPTAGDGDGTATRPGLFATTNWSVVLSAADTSGPSAQAALEELCRTYWYPLYAYARRQGHSPEDAQDLTQWVGNDFQEKQPLLELGPEVASVCFSEDGRLLACGSGTGLVQVADLQRRSIVRQ
jgi:hypothetical protein